MPFSSNIIYATVNHGAGNVDYKFDISTPSSGSNFPLIIYVHGGGWYDYNVTKASPPYAGETDFGRAVASIDYVMSDVAQFPAQIYCVKAAIRYIKANAATWSIDPNRICLAGHSAGGELAALAAMSGNGVLEGNYGNFLGQDSSVKCLMDGYGPYNFTTFFSQVLASPVSDGVKTNLQAVTQYLVDVTKKGAPSKGSGVKGGTPTKSGAGRRPPLKARSASPSSYVRAGAVPTYIFNGDADTTVTPSQNTNFETDLTNVGAYVVHDVIAGGGHGSYNATIQANQRAFWNAKL